MRLQRFSELTHIRDLLCQMALEAGRGAHDEKRNHLEDEISKFESALESVPERSRTLMESILQARKKGACGAFRTQGHSF